MEAFGLLVYGFSVLLTWKILALMMVGLVLGIFVGVLPGLGGPNGVAILLPLTFTMDPTSAIVMLSCIYWGARRNTRPSSPWRWGCCSRASAWIRSPGSCA